MSSGLHCLRGDPNLLFAPTHPDPPLRQIPRHIIPYAIVVKQPFNGSHRTDRDILIPQLLLAKPHHVIRSNRTDDTFNLAGIHSAAGGHNLSANVFSHGGGAVKRQ